MTAPRLRAEGLVVRYGHAVALDHVDVALSAGELVGLIGPNGSGKTTLLHTLLGARAPDAGLVMLDGAPLAAISPRERARALTMVVHAIVPDFPMRARELVALGRIPFEGLFGASSADDDDAIAGALAATDTTSLADRAIDTLSAGELQRVQLARAFAQRATIVLLDEPTANLDPQHQLEAMALVRRFVRRGGAAMIALHDLTTAATSCDRVIVLDRGRVRADGPPSRTLDETLLAEVFRVRARIRRDDDGEIVHVLPVESLSRSHTEGEPRP